MFSTCAVIALIVCPSIISREKLFFVLFFFVFKAAGIILFIIALNEMEAFNAKGVTQRIITLFPSAAELF